MLLSSGLDESFNACSNVPPSEQLACSARADRHALLRRPSESGSHVKLAYPPPPSDRGRLQSEGSVTGGPGHRASPYNELPAASTGIALPISGQKPHPFPGTSKSHFFVRAHAFMRSFLIASSLLHVSVY